jgi:hypothetical protein
MLNPEQNISPKALVGYVEYRGYRAEPLCRDGETVPYAFELRGPRGNKGFVGIERDGTCRLFSARLWCDSVDCANKYAAERNTIRALSRRAA